MACLSILLVAGPLRDRLERCLLALAAQSMPERMEIAIVDLAPEAPPLQLPPGLAPLLTSAPALSYGEARARALALTSAPLLAYLEDHVVPAPGWLDATLAAFDTGADAVNFSFENLNPASVTSRGCMLLAYGHWMAPMPPGPAGFIACHNVAYRRTALAPYLPDLPRWFEAEFFLHAHMRGRGLRFAQSSGAVLAHENWTRVSDACRDSGAFQQLFGSQRAALARWSFPRRLFYAAAMAACPPLHCARLARKLWRRAPHFAHFLAALPVIFAVYSYGAWREAIGYLYGEQQSRRELTDVEFRLERE
jgi:hypothetical protein